MMFYAEDVLRILCFYGNTINFDFKRRCAEWSVYDIKVPARAIREQMDPMFSNSSRGTLMSYTDHSVQRRLKSNTPNAISGQVIKVVALRG